MKKCPINRSPTSFPCKTCPSWSTVTVVTSWVIVLRLDIGTKKLWFCPACYVLPDPHCLYELLLHLMHWIQNRRAEFWSSCPFFQGISHIYSVLSHHSACPSKALFPTKLSMTINLLWFCRLSVYMQKFTTLLSGVIKNKQKTLE